MTEPNEPLEPHMDPDLTASLAHLIRVDARVGLADAEGAANAVLTYLNLPELVRTSEAASALHTLHASHLIMREASYAAPPAMRDGLAAACRILESAIAAGEREVGETVAERGSMTLEQRARLSRGAKMSMAPWWPKNGWARRHSCAYENCPHRDDT